MDARAPGRHCGHPAWLRCRRQPGALHADLRRKPAEARGAQHLQPDGGLQPPPRRALARSGGRQGMDRGRSRADGPVSRPARRGIVRGSGRYLHRAGGRARSGRRRSVCHRDDDDALGRTRRRAGRAQRERQADLRVLHVRRERTQPLGHGRDRRADRAAGHGHQRVRAQLLDRAGTDARAAAPPAGIRPRAADCKAQRRYAHHRRRQDRI